MIPMCKKWRKKFLGQDKRLTFTLGDGLEFLQQQDEKTYDFVFADALPGKYEGLQACLRIVKPGGFYVVDDMLPQPNWPAGHAEKVPVFLAELADRKDFVITPMEWASGLVIAVRKSERA